MGCQERASASAAVTHGPQSEQSVPKSQRTAVVESKLYLPSLHCSFLAAAHVSVQTSVRVVAEELAFLDRVDFSLPRATLSRDDGPAQGKSPENRFFHSFHSLSWQWKDQGDSSIR